jgi:hypothetical protein
MCEVPEHYGDPVIVPLERDLYQPLESFINGSFFAAHRPPHGAMRAVTAQTSSIQAFEGGTWTQPDVAAVLISRNKFAATAEVRLFSFEVKTRSGCQLQSVHEALAHTRFVNCSYLVWNRPHCICGDREFYNTIDASCVAYGVGLITIHDPGNSDTYEVRRAAQNKAVGRNEVDEFISTRFGPQSQAQIIDGLKMLCPGPL